MAGAGEGTGLEGVVAEVEAGLRSHVEAGEVLAERRVLSHPGGPVDDTAPAERPITVDDLLTFRLGLGGDFTDFSPSRSTR